MKQPLPLINENHALLQTENFELAAKDCELIAAELRKLKNSELETDIQQLEELKAQILAVSQLAYKHEYETWTQAKEWAYRDKFNSCVKQYECWMNTISAKLNDI